MMSERSNSPEITVMVLLERLQDERERSHQRLDYAELQSGLFTKAQESDGVSLAGYAACAIQVAES